jgi:DNA-binding transcriptional MerR regulator/effector-binding domain-containing protein
MYTIGEFAAFGRVSVRMLRHYDAIGLLKPARVDPATAYRFYADAQLLRLLRIAELREFGCSLDDAAEVLADPDERGALQRVLVRRSDELRAAIEIDLARLDRITTRLRHLEGEHTMSITLEYRRLEPVTVYAARTVAPGMGPENISPLIDGLLGGLVDALDRAKTAYREPGIFWYEPAGDGPEMHVAVSFTAVGEPVPGAGYEIVELPAVEKAAIYPYRGEMAGIGTAWMQLAEAVAAEGHHLTGPIREIYLESQPLPQSEWLTELVQPVASA